MSHTENETRERVCNWFEDGGAVYLQYVRPWLVGVFKTRKEWTPSQVDRFIDALDKTLSPLGAYTRKADELAAMVDWTGPEVTSEHLIDCVEQWEADYLPETPEGWDGYDYNGPQFGKAEALRALETQAEREAA